MHTMILEGIESGKRKSHSITLASDLVIVGGGMAGTCAAITAAREGLKVTLVQDRPVLGGNASSEIRLWVLGATSHMGNNNRWAREGGVIDELMVENMYRNPEGNPIILDTILIEKVHLEDNIKLLLNTSVYELEKRGEDQIDFVKAFCSQNSTEYILSAPLFMDASGDGILGFLSGAAFRMGAESKEEFDEQFAPDHKYGELLGHSLYFYSKDTGKPVRYIAPAYANTELSKLPRFKTFNLREDGCRLWWVEYGGRTDTIHNSEDIKWELWRIIYGIWDHVKNSGQYPNVENLTLEWVGTIPGKRESRRFEGDYIMHQKDVVEQREHFDAVSFGGWALDLHPADGVFSDKPGCTQWHSKGVYQIPFRTMYSRNIKNLFLGGRLISASHVAFGSTRVMATCAHNGQAIAMAAKLCKERNLLPSDLLASEPMKALQTLLIQSGQYIPKLSLGLENNFLQDAEIQVSSELELISLPVDGPWKSLEFSVAQLLPVSEGQQLSVKLSIKSKQKSTLKLEIRKSQILGNYTLDELVERKEIDVNEGEHSYQIDFDFKSNTTQYVALCLMQNDELEVKCSSTRLTGVLSIFNKFNKSVATSSIQSPPPGIGIDEFDFWVPERRPNGYNLAFELNDPLKAFGKDNLRNGVFRPTVKPNAWVASIEDKNPQLKLSWSSIKSIKEVTLFFDTDFDHPMESTLMGHPESEIPFCVKSYRIKDGNGKLLHTQEANHQTINIISFEQAVSTKELIIELDHPSESVPAALFGLICK
ncbi:FAD-dependent oxidoreductase [Algoriphagus aquimarinus]|uniref:2-polyprenyl-6-methoxyphenol hydroxylase n=1 Tax=Algoriphagus aquimarinus TaxID=237018 RepID=A0A1I1CDZ0_9BACT|nr:FAD-dependent oxidoreductase [Algoriphagus aquimarinus]SFB60915.1 2-polyprenyl-6-methoxyphenol hydroxylase [Algoriphagus aquimarinus]